MSEQPPQPAMELPTEELMEILEQAKVGAISADQYAKLMVVIQTFALLKEELQSKKTSIQRLKRMLFGVRTEKTRAVLGEQPDVGESEPRQQDNTRAPVAGHGRHGAAAYIGAQKIPIAHPSLHGGDACPGCARGKVYPMKDPGVRVRFSGVAPLQAKVFKCARLRCGLCGEVYTADTPAGVGDQKYDETAAVVVGMLRYSIGVPFNRIEKVQENLGIPLPSSTQWDLVHGAAQSYSPVFEGMQDLGADGDIVHNDDTTHQPRNSQYAFDKAPGHC